jgi:hypothetical protein
MGVGGEYHATAALPSGKRFYRRVGGHHGRSGRVQKISANPPFDPADRQPVA